jgi:outer membrane immunogenic protein
MGGSAGELGTIMKAGVKGLALSAAVALAAVALNDIQTVRADGGSPPYNWSGCYAGGFVGWATANKWTSTDLNGFSPAGVSPWDFSLGNEAIGGGTLGCNWQAIGWLVLGLEGEGGFLNVEGLGPQPLIVPPGFGTVGDTAKVGSGYGLVGSRVGVAFDRLLVYGKFGAAFYDSAATVTDANTPGFVAAGSRFQSTFAAGVGGEYLTFDHWSGKAEYLFFDHGSSFNACGVNAGRSFCWKQDPSTVNTFKIGVNYKFW